MDVPVFCEAFFLLHSPSAEIFRTEGGIATCTRLLSCSLDIIKCKAILCLAHATNERETELLSASNQLIMYLLKLLKDCSNQSDHTGKLYPFKATELIVGLNQLNTNDANSQKSVRLGILEIYSIFVHSPADNEELEAVVTGIWTLSFSPANRTAILGANWILQRLQRLVYHESPGVAQASKGSLWILSESENSPGFSTTETSESENPVDGDEDSEELEQHIMLSYQWEFQETVIKLKDQLKAANFNVWMDIEQMSGSTLEAMAGAVENSSIILVCFSESYRRSPNCRTEAEYAFKISKPIIPIRLQSNYNPLGWLGMLLGTKLYFDISTPSRFQSKIQPLFREIRTVLGDSAPNEQGMLESLSSCKAKSWGREEVQNWLIAADIPLEQLEKLRNLDGPLILGLRKMLIRAPVTYYATLKQDFAIDDIVILLKFTNLLEELD